jgi:hypothetical protein
MMPKTTGLVLSMLVILGWGAGPAAGQQERPVRRPTVTFAREARVGQPATPARLQVWWEFRTETEKMSDGLVTPPYTEIFLVIGGKPPERVRIGRYQGTPNIRDELEGPHLPKEVRDAVLSCWTWYAGAGDELFVLQQGRSLVVKWRPLDEQMARSSRLKTIRTITLEKNVEVEARDKHCPWKTCGRISPEVLEGENQPPQEP